MLVGFRDGRAIIERALLRFLAVIGPVSDGSVLPALSSDSQVNFSVLDFDARYSGGPLDRLARWRLLLFEKEVNHSCFLNRGLPCPQK